MPAIFWVTLAALVLEFFTNNRSISLYSFFIGSNLQLWDSVNEGGASESQGVAQVRVGFS